MFSSRSNPDRTGNPLKRLLTALVLAAIAIFVIVAAYKAVIAPWQIDDFPEELAVKAELLPVTFTLHMISGGLALMLVPCAILLRRRPRWHRPVARIAALDVVVAGVTAFPVALVAPVTAWSAWAFTVQGAVWLTLLGLGLWHIRSGRAEQHRACMLLMAATMTGAIFFRVYLALWAIIAQGRQYELFYAIAAWAAWSVPLALTALVLQQQGIRRNSAP
ncbi:DUF2306 domain-containing protein [Novosphingobium sp.]|uniref:DUF2306 domain-containing protein n=1 Tax=Novosphingobium sp. TaxID=1874826 RepID=UPI00273571EC|nr:DUF2306 domain-containing protein [Novosphingobium sp.]MDP3907068.1 DUF2306 domain-containing protein [Novosphingobium sp.]